MFALLGRDFGVHGRIQLHIPLHLRIHTYKKNKKQTKMHNNTHDAGLGGTGRHCWATMLVIKQSKPPFSKTNAVLSAYGSFSARIGF
jgi:hypothetical protein